MKDFDENTHNPTTREREINHGYRRAQEASSILLLLIFLTLVFAISTTCGAEETKASKAKPYPDKWYMPSDEKNNKITEICFSDADIWGNEPVFILEKPEENKGTAIGFFSGKQKNIQIKYSQKGLNMQKYYANTNREVECREIPSKDRENIFEAAMPDGGKLEHKVVMTLSQGEIIAELLPGKLQKSLRTDISEEEFKYSYDDEEIEEYLKQLTRGEIIYETFSIKGENEPAPVYLVKRDGGGKIAWAKAYVRYYPIRSEAPKDPYDQERTMRIDSGSYPWLFLADKTMLIRVPGAVLRIRQEDGGTKAIPDRNLRVFDAVDVMKAKMELMKKEAALSTKCAMEGKDLTSAKCHLYYGKDDGYERLDLDLAKRLFGAK